VDEDGKAKDRKERNRRNARETRRRKKEYMACLRDELDGLRAANLALEGRARAAETDAGARRAEWFAILAEALALRARAEADPERWARVMDADVVFVQPITPYRSFRESSVVADRVMFMGLRDVIADAHSLQDCLSSLCSRRGPLARLGEDGGPRPQVQVRFELTFEECHFGPRGLMAPFEMTTLNLAALGLRSEVTMKGSLRAAFVQGRSGEYKLKQLDSYFDPIAVWKQMK
jgi:hypothetical protein